MPAVFPWILVETAQQAAATIDRYLAWDALVSTVDLERAKDVSSMVAVFFGPIVLAGGLGSSNIPNDLADKDAYLSTPAATVPLLAASSSDPTDWLSPVTGTPLAYKVQNAGSADGITFRPLYQVHLQRYSVYWPLQTAK